MAEQMLVQNEKIYLQIARQFRLPVKQVEAVIRLLQEGNTVPFIARYRKERTGGLDEVQIRDISEAWAYANQLERRKEEVLRFIKEQGKLTETLRKNVLAAERLQEVEDLYRPYRKKRQTRATKAKEKGLQPLADKLLSGAPDLHAEAKAFINRKRGVETAEEALAGARDIIAEQAAEDPEVRRQARNLFRQHGMIKTERKADADDPKGIYEMYADYEEPVQSIVPHRVLAINRGEKEGVLRVSITAPKESVIQFMLQRCNADLSMDAGVQIREAVTDGYRRLVAPAVEREIRKELTEKAEEQAIRIFSENLQQLLMQPPLKGKVVLGVDPAYRTGCKLAVVDETGKLLAKDVIYPVPPKQKIEEARQKLGELIKRYKVEVIAIGNGTASRETERFVSNFLRERAIEISYIIVNEAGASVYSASDLARQEFPDLEVQERSAVSIARRLQDPLAELVKIDPRSVGVGQYQHDVSQKKLHHSLAFVVETAVNRVGVNVNTASVSLLQYVSGLTKTTANNIVKRREELGKFHNRRQLKGIPRLGEKTYEQCIGFLRISDGDEPFDRTSIHPESYKETERLLEELGLNRQDVGSERLRQKVQEANSADLARKLQIGLPTLRDILTALSRPERDPRDELPKPLLKQGILELDDLEIGMELEGTIRNIVDFGAFVDIGLKQDGLVHVSKLARRFVRHPLDVVRVGQIVRVWVDDVDRQKERVSLTMVPPS